MPRLKLSDKTPEYKVQYWIECLLRDRNAYGPYEIKRRVGMLLWYAALNHLPVPKDFMSDFSSTDFQLVTPTTAEVKILEGQDIPAPSILGNIFDNVIGEKK
jgi:hypothetical protein